MSGMFPKIVIDCNCEIKTKKKKGSAMKQENVLIQYGAFINSPYVVKHKLHKHRLQISPLEMLRP